MLAASTARLAACTSPKTYVGLIDGAHSFQVRATDLFGNTDATPAGFNWTIDIIPPETTITVAPAATTTSTSAGFEFTATEPATFACSLNGAAFSNCATPQNYTGLAIGPHTFLVRAIDAAGNFDTTPAGHSWTINALDVTPPDTTITSAPPALTNNTSATFEFSWTEANSNFRCSLDGAPTSSCTTPHSYAGLTSGSHNFSVQATDAFGNVDLTPAVYAWTIDTVAPNTTFTGTPPALTNGTSVRFDFVSTEAGSTFGCSLDGAAFSTCTSPTILHGLAAGSHTFQVQSTDQAGNTDPTPASFTFTIDIAAPSLTSFIVNTPALDTTNGPANVSTTLTMTDDASGVSTPTVGVAGRTSFSRSSSCVLSSGTLLNQTYQCTGTLPQYSESGVSQFSLRLRDVTGNTTVVTNARLVDPRIARLVY